MNPRTTLAYLIRLTALTGLLAAGCGQAAKEEGDEAVKPIVRVEVQPVVRATLRDTIEVIGTSQPLRDRTAHVTTAVEGQVAEILPRPRPLDSGGDTDPHRGDPMPQGLPPVHLESSMAPTPLAEGDLVRKGQVLVRLEESAARAAVVQAKGTLTGAEAALTTLEKTPRQELIQAARAAVESADLAVKTNQQQLDLLKGLAGRNLVSQVQLANAQVAMQTAQSNQQSAVARLLELVKEPYAQKVEELRTNVAAARAKLEAARVSLRLDEVRSPIEGRLGLIQVFLGQSLPLGSPVATVSDLRRIEVQALVPAREIGRVLLMQDATIWWGGGPDDQHLEGKVSFISQQAEPGAAGFVVKVQADNPHEALRAGMSVHVRITTRTLPEVLAVPPAAIVEDGQGRPTLFVVKDHKAHQVAPEVGVRTPGLVQVRGPGIAAGVPVVVKGNYYLPDDTEVRLGAEPDEPAGAERAKPDQAKATETPAGPAAKAPSPKSK